ncbi:MAG: dienelactone hydrolase family protein [Deltaproteobacteria bacterium]|nr:MAG: dienelactone hydrolase family protein [Deltaproteobacteria bacterium]
MTLLCILAIFVSGTAVQAAVVTKSVPYQHNDVTLEGYLAYDDSFKGKRPGVLIVHEWWGLNDYARRRAEQLAMMGYIAFALDMYGKGKVTPHPNQAVEWMNQINQNIQTWRRRAMAGLQVLNREPLTDKNRIAAIGYCFGGSTVQQLAYGGAHISGVVSFHGSLISPANVQANDVKAKILICHGSADPFAKPAQVQHYLATMEKSGLDWQMIFYGGAKHSFTNPDADKVDIPALGYNKSADQRSWQHMKIFFDQIFGKD